MTNKPPLIGGDGEADPLGSPANSDALKRLHEALPAAIRTELRWGGTGVLAVEIHVVSRLIEKIGLTTARSSL